MPDFVDQTMTAEDRLTNSTRHSSKPLKRGSKPALHGLVLLLQSFIYAVRYFDHLIRPNLVPILFFVFIHLLISRNFVGVVIRWERALIDQVLYGRVVPALIPFNITPWQTSEATIRLLKWSQTKWLTFYLARDLRRRWKHHFKAKLVEIEGLKSQGISLTYKKPRKNSSAPSSQHFLPRLRFLYYFKLGWFAALSSTWVIRCALLFLSTPIHTVPYVGPWLYMYIHSGIKARRICAEYSRTQAHWDRLERRKFCAQTASLMRTFACCLEILEDCPLGCVITPILDMSVVIWMCQCKGLESLAMMSVEKIETRPSAHSITSPATTTTTTTAAAEHSRRITDGFVSTKTE